MFLLEQPGVLLALSDTQAHTDSSRCPAQRFLCHAAFQAAQSQVCAAAGCYSLAVQDCAFPSAET